MKMWINDNGRSICPRCATAGKGGHYLQEAVAAAPQATEVWTPLGSWELFTVKQIGCESCMPLVKEA